MKESLTRYVAVVAMVSLMLLVYLWPRPVERKGMVSASNLVTLTLGPKGEVISGLWTFSLVVDRYDTIRFLLKPENTSVASAQQYSGPSLPPGSKLVSNKGLDISFEPLGNPWTYGIMKQYNWVYDDGTGTTRVWSYYAMEGDWKFHFVPYRITIKEYPSGTVLATKDVLSGTTESGYGVETVTDLPYGIKVHHLGFLLGGVVFPPVSDFAYIFGRDGEPKYVRRGELEAALKANSTLGKGKVKIALVSSDPEGDASTNYKHFHEYYSSLGRWVDTTMDIRVGADELVECPEIWIDSYQHTLFGSRNYYWTFQVKEMSPGFDPEKVRATLVGGKLGSNDRVYLKDEFGKWVDPTTWVKLGPQKEFTLKYYSEDGTLPDVTYKFEFMGRAESWNEVVGQVGIDTLEEYKGVPKIVQQVALQPAGFTVWKGTPLYSPTCQEVPGMVPGTIYSVGTEQTVLAELSTKAFSAFITVEVPVEAFDSWVYIPPYGKPKIEKVDVTQEATGGGEIELAITVKNEGMTPDVFRVGSLNLPPEVVTKDTTYGSATIAPGQTVVLRYTLSVGKVEREYTGKISGTVVAVGNPGEPDRFEVEVKLKPGGMLPTLKGDLWVYVVDKNTRKPIPGATVRCGTFEVLTDANGLATFSSLTTGEYTVEVRAEGYWSTSKTVEVKVGTVTETIPLTSTKERRIPWKGIAIAASVLPLISGVAYYLYSKKVRK